MSYLSIFRTNENQKQKWDSIIYEISEFVSAFFWDEAPDKYGLEAREGQQDMAFAILDAVRGNYHFAVEAGVGIGKSFAYLVPLLLYNKINAMIAATRFLKKLFSIDGRSPDSFTHKFIIEKPNAEIKIHTLALFFVFI